MFVLIKAYYIFSAISIKTLGSFFTIIEDLIWRHKRLRIAKANLKKKSTARSITIPDFTYYHRYTVIRTV